MSIWHQHDGMSDPPVGGERMVEVRFRDGDTAQGRMHDWDQNWQWRGSADGMIAAGAIVAYRLLPIAKPTSPSDPAKG